jgi:hypothetical protein
MSVQRHCPAVACVDEKLRGEALALSRVRPAVTNGVSCSIVIRSSIQLPVPACWVVQLKCAAGTIESHDISAKQVRTKSCPQGRPIVVSRLLRSVVCCAIPRSLCGSSHAGRGAFGCPSRGAQVGLPSMTESGVFSPLSAEGGRLRARVEEKPILR